MCFYGLDIHNAHIYLCMYARVCVCVRVRVREYMYGSVRFYVCVTVCEFVRATFVR